MAHRGNHRNALFVASAIIGLVFGLAYYRSRPRSATATPIPGYAGHASRNCEWLDEHTYLTIDAHFPRTRLLKVDIGDGSERVVARFPLPAVQIHAQGRSIILPGTLSGSPNAGAVSPDHAKALWNSTDGWQLVDLATGTIRRMGTGTAENTLNPSDPSPGENAAWMPDSSEWVSAVWHLGKPTTLMVRDLNGRLLSTGSIGTASGQQKILGVLPGDIVVLYENTSLYFVDSRRGFSTRVTTMNHAFGSGALSPDRRHIAWDQETYTFWPILPGPLHGVSPSTPQSVTDTFFITDAEGRHPHEIGSYSRRFSEVTAYDYVYSLAWMPDGRHISFANHGKLWTMPVDAR